MTVKQTNFVLWSVAALLGTSAIGALLGGIAKPLHQIESLSVPVKPALPTDSARRAAIDSAPLLETVYSRAFRPDFNGSSANASPMPSTPSSDDVTATEIQLIGTIGSTLAILRGPDGTDAIAEVGDDVNGEVITAIRPSQLDLKTPRGVITLQRAPETSPADVKIGP